MNIFLNIQLLNRCFKWFKKTVLMLFTENLYIEIIVQFFFNNCTTVHCVMHSHSFTFFKKHQHDIKGMNCLCIFFMCMCTLDHLHIYDLITKLYFFSRFCWSYFPFNAGNVLLLCIVQ